MPYERVDGAACIGWWRSARPANTESGGRLARPASSESSHSLSCRPMFGFPRWLADVLVTWLE